MLLALEQIDVFGLSRQPHVGQRVEAARADLGKKIAVGRQHRPRLATEVAQLEAERFGRLLPEDIVGVPQLPRVDRSGGEVAGGNQPIDVARVDADERRVEARFERLGAAEDLQLSFLCRRLWMKPHLAAPEQHEPGDALVGLGDEDTSRGEREVEIFGGNRHVARLELLGGVERQPVKVFHRREALLVDDAPGVADSLHIDTPRGEARAGPVLDEGLDHEAIAVSALCAAERLAIALLHGGACGARQELGAGEFDCAVSVGGRVEKPQIAFGVAGLRDLLELPQQWIDGVGLLGAQAHSVSRQRQRDR